MKIYNIPQLPPHTYTDSRGMIMHIYPEDLAGREIKSIMIITGQPGSERGNHWHKKDEHWCHVLRGEIDYFWIDEKGELKSIHLTPGMTVHSPAGEKHKFVFKTRGAFVAMALLERTQPEYESDTVREKI